MVIALQEFEQIRLAKHALTQAQARQLQERYRRQLDVRWLFESEQWQLTAKGWVGSLPLGKGEIAIRPKIPLHNLYQLLEVADKLPIQDLTHTVQRDTLAGFYERLAVQLADLVQQRVRRGLYQAYQPRSARLPYVKGRLHVDKLQPGQHNFPVSFSQISADNPYNQLLYAALHRILQTNLLRTRHRDKVRAAYRKLRGQMTLCKFPSPHFVRLTYTRLNVDYEPMHALCRFFLTHTMPIQTPGSAEALPFLVDMAALFERFVAMWLRQNLPPDYALRIQERSELADGKIKIAIDLVIIERATGRVKMVLDTKWKAAEKSTNDDIYQITFYANTRLSPEAVLIYPLPLARPLDETIRDVRLRTLAFDVSTSIEQAGKTFMTTLFENCKTDRNPNHSFVSAV